MLSLLYIKGRLSKKYTWWSWLRHFMSRWGLWPILILGLAIRLLGINECFWYDESFTSAISTLSPQRALVAIAGDVHPPLYYLLAWLSARVFGNNEISQRLPAFIAGMVVIYATFHLSQILKAKHGLWWSFLVAIMPAQIYYSNEARQYTLLCLLVLLAIIAVAKSKYLTLWASITLIMYTHNLGVLYCIPLALWGLIKGKNSFIKHSWLSLFYLPWVPTLIKQLSAVGSGFWIIQHNLGETAYQLLYVIMGYRLAGFTQLHVAMIATMIFCIAVAYGWRHKLYGLLSVAVVPSILMTIISYLWKPIYLERVILPSGIIIVALFAEGIGAMGKYARSAMIACVVPLLAFTIYGYYQIPRENYRVLAEYLNDSWRSGDAIYHVNISSAVFLSHYLPGKDTYMMPGSGDLSQSLTDETKLAMGLKQIEIPVEAVAHNHDRLWLMEAFTPTTTEKSSEQITNIESRYLVILRKRVIDTRFGIFDVVLLDLKHEQVTD